MRRQLFVNGALLALALGTLGVVWATRETATTSELESRKNKLLPSFRKDAVSRLVLSQDGRELQLEADEAGEFRIVKPWPERADIATVNQLLGALDLASALRPADGISAEKAGLTAPALGIRVEMAKNSQTLRLGGLAPSPAGARYAEVTSDGASRRFVVSQGVSSELSLPFDKFREPRLLDYGRRELQKLELTQGDQKLTLLQAEHGAFFVELSGGRELASRELTERVFNALSRLSTEHFLEADEARKTLAGSALRVTLTLTDKSSAPVQLTFGACPGAANESLVLKEQPGKAPRAGCVPAELASALQVTADDARLLGPFAARPDEVEELRITRGAQKLELARKDKAFLLRTPGNAEVPLDAGNARISAIVEAQGQRPPTTDLAQLGLSPGSGELSIQIAGADEAAHRTESVVVGKPRQDGSVCVKRNADAVLLCFGAETARAFEPDPSLLKGLGIFRFAPSELSLFNIEADGLGEIVRRQEDGSYELDEPKGFRHDGSLVADAVQTLGTLQAVRWAGSGDEQSFGLATPRLRISVTLAGSTARELSVGAPTTDGFFARLTAEPGVFVLPRSVVAELSIPLVDRSLCPFAETELMQLDLRGHTRSFSLKRRGETWEGTDITPTRARELVEVVTALRAEFAVHLGAARPAEGLAKPSATVSGTSANGKHYRLSLGARATLNDSAIVYARLDGVDATFALSRRAAVDLQNP
jgi:Domain of unknown function (DUF4340)